MNTKDALSQPWKPEGHPFVFKFKASELTLRPSHQIQRDQPAPVMREDGLYPLNKDILRHCQRNASGNLSAQILIFSDQDSHRYALAGYMLATSPVDIPVIAHSKDQKLSSSPLTHTQDNKSFSQPLNPGTLMKAEGHDCQVRINDQQSCSVEHSDKRFLLFFLLEA